MSSPIDGFRKNLEQVLPEHLTTCEERVVAAEENLREQKAALDYVRSLAGFHGIQKGKAKPAPSLVSSDAGVSTADDDAGASPQAKQ